MSKPIYNHPRSMARAFVLSFLYSETGDRLREVFTHDDLDKIPPDCEAVVKLDIRHKRGLSIQPEPTEGKKE